MPSISGSALASLYTALTANLPPGVQPEDQLKPPIKAVVESLGTHIEVFTEVRTAYGRPDAVVRVHGAICGYIELKAPSKGADATRLRGEDKAQWKNFQALPNLIYTDGFDWTLYRSGKKVATIRGVCDAAGAQNDDAVRKLEPLLSDFLQWEPIVPDTPKALAEMLAPLCRKLRDDVAEVLENENSVLRRLSAEIRQALFPNASHRDFADTYAQTLTYAFLLARLLGLSPLTADAAVQRLASGHRLLSEVLQHMAHPAARAEVKTAVDVLERVIGAVDGARLSRRGDPWVYFYEHFLEAYDPKLRRESGVYYTPAEVVQCQVRLGDELLRTRFGKTKGYADDGVVFLDPAAGTASYPLAMIEHALAVVEQRFGKGMVAAAASELAKNVHAFEILVGPYAVGHLRISEALGSAGAMLPPDGLPVYLTDTLESPNAEVAGGGIFNIAMTEEHRRATRIKRDVRVLVCMGNPPYYREKSDDPASATPTAERKGGWVRFGDRSAQPGRVGAVAQRGQSQASEEVAERPILEDFLEPTRLAGLGGHLKNLYNDYVYFWRWALWKVFENPRAHGPGIVSFITASSYLRGPGFVGMRQKMREAFDEIWIIDLGGDNLGARKTPNVFVIQNPVAIAIGMRSGEPSSQPARTWYTRIDADSREAKLEKIERIHAFADLEWQETYDGWMKPFLPKGHGDYYDWPLLTDVFPWQHSGVQYKRNWPIAVTMDVAEARWEKLLASPEALRASLFKESGDRRINKTYEAIFTPGRRLPAIRSLERGDLPECILGLSFRSFDKQLAIVDKRVCSRPREPLWIVQGPQQVFLTSLLTGVLGLGPAATVCAYVPDLHHFRGSFGGKDAVPLWRDPAATQPNITAGLLNLLSAKYGHEVSAEDLFAYVYAMLATPEYVERFSEELVEPGPRLPLTRDAALFDEAVKQGRALIFLHTYGERVVPEGQRSGQVPQGAARLLTPISDRSDAYPEDFDYDPATRTLKVGTGEISPVTPEVFGFSVSGFEVVKSWLAYRMKDGAGRQSSELDKIRPERWTAQMSRELLELLWVLEHTVARYPALADLFDRIVAGPLLRADDLPKPSDAEREPPGVDDETEDSPEQVGMDI